MRSARVCATARPPRRRRSSPTTPHAATRPRVSPTSPTTGGGAIYGCRSTAGGSAANPPKNPCIRANNLSTGFAFEFNATGAESAGSITVGAGGDAKKPFTTNATGVATGLNADRVDGVEAAALKSRWLLVNEAGQIEEQSGGFTILDAYQTNQNVYIDSGASLEGKGLQATIAIQNKINTGGADDAPDPNFEGEVSVARCQTVAVECAPPSSKTPNAFVFSARDSDGNATNGTTSRASASTSRSPSRAPYRGEPAVAGCVAISAWRSLRGSPAS